MQPGGTAGDHLQPPRRHAEIREQGEIVRAALGAERKLVAGVEVFDIYEGTGVPEGQKSVAVAVRLQPVERTLTDAEIEAVSQKIVAEVSRKTGASLRA